MSILIKGMEMPKAGNWKTVRIYCDGTCAEPNWQGDCKYMQGCEAIPVQPHGRLIDADALEMERRAENAKKGWLDSFAVVFNGDPYYEAAYDFTEQFKELVNNAPTVIPAEEGE